MTGESVKAAALLALASSLSACRRSNAEEIERKPTAELSSKAASTPAIRSSMPEPWRFTLEVQATGTLKPRQAAQLSTPVPGTLEKTLVRAGQRVKAGAPLATLRSSGARAALTQAAAGVSVAQAQLAVAEDELERTAALRATDTLTEAQLIQVKGQRDVAASQLQAARAQLNQAAVFFSDHTLKAPFSGVIVSAPKSTGIQVDPAVPLFVLEDVSSLVLEASVTQDEAADLPPNAVLSVEVLDTGARVDGAVLRAVVPSVDPTTNRVPIEVEVPNPEGRLLPHTVARVRLVSAQTRDAYRVRASALTQREGAFSLWMVAADGKVIAPRVRVLGHQEGGFAVVDPGPSGFPSGARVLDAPPTGVAVGVELSREVKGQGR